MKARSRVAIRERGAAGSASPTGTAGPRSQKIEQTALAPKGGQLDGMPSRSVSATGLRSRGESELGGCRRPGPVRWLPVRARNWVGWGCAPAPGAATVPSGVGHDHEDDRATTIATTDEELASTERPDRPRRSGRWLNAGDRPPGSDPRVELEVLRQERQPVEQHRQQSARQAATTTETPGRAGQRTHSAGARS